MHQICMEHKRFRLGGNNITKVLDVSTSGGRKHPLFRGGNLFRPLYARLQLRQRLQQWLPRLQEVVLR